MICLSRQIDIYYKNAVNALFRVKTNVNLCNAYMLNGIFNVRGNSKVEELAFRQSNSGKW